MTDSIVLVTGATRGIGREIAAGLAALGHTVLLGARDPGHGTRVAAEVAAERSGDVHPLALDVTDTDSVRAAAVHVDARYGRLDALVNNAGIAGDFPTQMPGQADVDIVRSVFTINVFGVIAVTEAMLPLLRRSPAPRIVNVSSSMGSLARMTDPWHYFSDMPGSLAYSPSKAALNQVTVQYAKQLRADGILVNAADPGACATDSTAGVPGITRTAADGAAVAIRLAILPDGGPTGGYVNDVGAVPW